MKVVFDAGPLITSCKFTVRGRLILDFVLDGGFVAIPTAVYDEVMRAPMRFADAREARQRVDAGKIQVVAPQLDPSIQTILNLYRLGDGEQQAILLMRQQDYTALIVDDHLAYLVADRLHVSKRFFLDLIVGLQQAGQLDITDAKAIVAAVRPRYPPAFVEHTLRMLG